MRLPCRWLRNFRPQNYSTDSNGFLKTLGRM